MVEVGVWHGVTTRVILQSMSPEGRLFAVDPFYVGRLGVSLHKIIARRETRRFAAGRIVWLRTTGEQAAELLWRESQIVDFVFLDGDHTYEATLADWNGWSKLVEPGGVILLHDSRSTTSRAIQGAGSVQVTNDVIRTDRRFEVIEEVDTLTVVRRLYEMTP